MSRPVIVGVTGGIGSGKSTVCKILEQLGVIVYYADDRAKELMYTNNALVSAIIKEFGVESYNTNGTLNRRYLAETVFGDGQQLAKLNAMVHPAVGKDFEQWANKQHAPIIAKEAALLIENGSYKQLDSLITVMAPQKIRLNRVLIRDSQRSKEQVLDIMNRQVDDAKRKEVSDYLIDNGEEKLLIPQVLKIHQQLLKKGSEI